MSALERAMAMAVALAIGVGIGLRGLYVSDAYNRLGGYQSISGGGMIVGLGSTMLLVFILTVWRRLAAPDGVAWQLFAAVEVGLWIGGIAGWAVFSSSPA